MNLSTPQNFDVASQKEAKDLRDKVIWEWMKGISMDTVKEDWLETLAERTRINYRSGFSKLAEHGIVNPFISLQAFSVVNHDEALDKIKQLPMAETTRQARAGLYCSFTRYLARRFKGSFTKAEPCKTGNAKTFYRVHEKVVTEAMDLQQWTSFFKALESINPRDSVIGKVALQGGKRIREVLHLRSDQINWEKREITFTQSKTRGAIKQTVITYSESIIADLWELVGGRDGFVFISSRGKPISLTQVANTFAKAGKAAGISFKVTPHTLRASAVTFLKQQGFADSEIAKITGHASVEMIHAYDKTDRADNPTKRVNLVS